MSDQLRGCLCGERYIIGELIGSGSFGTVYRGIDTYNRQPRHEESPEVAIKVVRVSQCKSTGEGLVQWMLRHSCHIPNVRTLCSLESEHAIAIVMDCLGPTLCTLQALRGRFSLNTVLLLADQLITAVEHIHAHGYLHRDLTPDNMLIGLHNNRSQVYLIDFGSALPYRIHDEHIPHNHNSQHVCGKVLCARSPFASTFTHLGFAWSRRCDMESLGYCLLFLLKGKLPWEEPEAGCDESHPQQPLPYTMNDYLCRLCEMKENNDYLCQLCEKKLAMPLCVMCEGCPQAFLTYMAYCQRLEHEDEPDYYYLRQLFREELEEPGLRRGSKFDWDDQNNSDEEMDDSNSDDDVLDDSDSDEEMLDDDNDSDDSESDDKQMEDTPEFEFPSDENFAWGGFREMNNFIGLELLKCL